ncbi:MAG: BrnT family toxin [Candidatus Thiodiazotropha sp.]|nr:BrnT family toxin [Candidatus Thiodiazotropha sp.]MCM8882274.1 BrnT family toxin [Candidatus Thiodiazotropha sp.]
MEYEWDPRKAKSNLLKHGIDFADAVIALEDKNALTIEDKDHHEVRFKTLAMGPYINVLYIIHAEASKHCIRIISARKANKIEIRYYFQGLDDE